MESGWCEQSGKCRDLENYGNVWNVEDMENMRGIVIMENVQNMENLQKCGGKYGKRRNRYV